MSTQIQTMLINILMGQCPCCGERFEFSSGRCARSADINTLADLEQTILEWQTTNRQQIKDLLSERRQLDIRVQKMSWKDYDSDVETEVSKSQSSICKFVNQLCGIIPILGLVNSSDDAFSSSNHLIHILELLC
jgi:hypothetical protein